MEELGAGRLCHLQCYNRIMDYGGTSAHPAGRIEAGDAVLHILRPGLGAVMDATKGIGAEVVLEMSGNARAIDQGTRMLARGGRMSLLGLPDGPVTLDLNDQVIFKEARLQGITGREMFRTWQQTTTLLSTGRVDVAPVITHRFTLEKYEEAFATTASGRSGKVIILPGD